MSNPRPKSTKPKPAADMKRRADGHINITLNPDAVADVQRLQEELVSHLGFRPSYSQVVQYVVQFFRSQHSTKAGAA